jgi:diguanylate cyclase (GGDEF)-like protein
MRVLIADDEELTRVSLALTLRKWGYEVIDCADGAEALERMSNEGGPDIAILDWMMPGMDGPDICRHIREAGRETYQYLILLSSRDSSTDVVQGLSSGADDYLVKPFNPMELKVRIRAGRRIVEMQRELVQARNLLLKKATHDPLTGLWNRLRLMEVFDAEMERAGREQQALTVMMIDIDHFKNVNDTMGHLTGDEVLRAVAGRMKDTLRSYDYIGRYGGEEFLVITPHCAAEEAAMEGERLRMAVGERQVDTSDGFIGVTISVGVSVYDPAKEAPPLVHDLLDRADTSLYQAKEAGRNRVVVDGVCVSVAGDV